MDLNLFNSLFGSPVLLLLSAFKRCVKWLQKFLGLTVLLFSLGASNLLAEPWVDTRDAWLRADIERLSRAGIIDSPINTWPLI